jgi:hypothetical protein
MKIGPTLLLAAALLASRASAAAPLETEFAAARAQATEANFRNDRAGLTAAAARFVRLTEEAGVPAPALYEAAWCEWMRAAAELTAKDTAAANATLEGAAARLRRALELQPENGEAHALLGWVLLARATTAPGQFGAYAAAISQQRKLALSLAPRSPRVAMFDGTLLFYSPAPGARERGLARWTEALALVDAERVADPFAPHWGRTLARGWLANLLVLTTPPRLTEARELAHQALAERPDWWWVRTQVLPATERGN